MTVKRCPELKKDLWAQWAQAPSVSLKHKLYDAYADWMVFEAKILYRKLKIISCDLADYIHYATVGLLESIDRYDVSSNIPFEVFTIKRLKGEILNNVVKFSEKANGHDQLRKLEKSKFISFINKQKKNPTEALIELTIDLYLLELLENHNVFELPVSQKNPYQSMEFEQLKRQMYYAIDNLNQNEQTIIRYHYFYQWGFSEIAERLVLSKGRVSQLHKEAIEKIKSTHFKDTDPYQ